MQRSGFPGGSVVENLPAKAGEAGDLGSTPVSGKSLGGGNVNPLQYSCLENPMDRGAWQATVQGVAKIQTLLRTYIHTQEYQSKIVKTVTNLVNVL